MLLFHQNIDRVFFEFDFNSSILTTFCFQQSIQKRFLSSHKLPKVQLGHENVELIELLVPLNITEIQMKYIFVMVAVCPTILARRKQCSHIKDRKILNKCYKCFEFSGNEHFVKHVWNKHIAFFRTISSSNRVENNITWAKTSMWWRHKCIIKEISSYIEGDGEFGEKSASIKEWLVFMAQFGFGWNVHPFSCHSSLFNITIQLSDARTYLFTETNTDFTITASHPMRINGNIKVNVDRMGSSERCVPTLVLFTFTNYLPASVHTICKKWYIHIFILDSLPKKIYLCFPFNMIYLANINK